jgi:hypothetical protein
VYHTPLVGAGIAPWAQALVSLKLEPPAEVQPGVNPEQEDVGKKVVLSTPCREVQVLSEKQQVLEMYAPVEGPEENPSAHASVDGLLLRVGTEGAGEGVRKNRRVERMGY